MQSFYQKKNDVTNTFAPTDVICETEKFILNLYCKNKAINQFDNILKKVDKYFNSPTYIRLPSNPQDLNEDFSIFSLNEFLDCMNEVEDYGYFDEKNDCILNLMILLCELEELSYLAESENNYLMRMRNLKDEFIRILQENEELETSRINNACCSSRDEKIAYLKDKYGVIKNKIVLHIEEACEKPTMRHQKIDPPRDNYDQFVKALKKKHQLELINFARSEVDHFYTYADDLRYLNHINCSIFSTLGKIDQTLLEGRNQLGWPPPSERDALNRASIFNTSKKPDQNLDQFAWLKSERDGIEQAISLVEKNLLFAVKLRDTAKELEKFLDKSICQKKNSNK